MSQNKTTRIGMLRRTAALLCAAFAGLSFAGAARAQSPIADPNPSPAVPTPYSSPLFHAGGAFTPPPFATPTGYVPPPAASPVQFTDPLYSELMGTPTGLVAGTGADADDTVPTEIPSFLLGNWDPLLPPTTPGTYFPNHFRDGTAFSWSAPLTFLTPAEVVPASSVTGTPLIPNVESTPTAVNVTEYPFIKNMQYVGTLTGTASTADTTLPSGSTTIAGLHSGTAPAGTTYVIRQVVYFGRSENLTTAAGAVTPVGAIYCVDGFTGEVIWRYQTPYFLDPNTGAYRDPAVFSTPAVAYMNVLVTPAVGATPAVYANKAVVVVGDNNGFVYCLDATGNGDGTSNINATTASVSAGVPGQPIYGAQPIYPVTTSATTGSHVGTTDEYWVYRPDVLHPLPSTGSSLKFDPQSVLPVPGPFGLASPNIYVDHGVSTTPDANGLLANNTVIYIGNTRDCMYAFDGLGVANVTPPYNASLPATEIGISNAVPTASPRWWFTPDSAAQNGTSFESTPAIAPPAAPFPTATVITATPNPVQPDGTSTITYTVTVTDESGSGGAPTGTVTLTSSDGAAITPTPITLTGGTGTATATAPAATPAGGQLTISGNYSGDSNFDPSTADAFYEQVYGGIGTYNTVITSSANPSVLGQSVTFTATLFAGGPAPTSAVGGTVVFQIDGAAQPAQADTTGTVTFTTSALTTGAHSITTIYTPLVGAAVSTTFNQTVYGLIGPTVYIGSSQELGVGSNAGRIYAIDGANGPKFAGTAGGVGHTNDLRPLWAYPSLYATGPGSVLAAPVGTAPAVPIGVRPALGNITGSPVVFTNTDDIVAAVGTVPAHPRTRIYFAADTGVEVPYTVAGNAAVTVPNPRPAADTTGRIWAVNTDGTTATTTTAVGPPAVTTVWSFPEANDPNNPTSDTTPEPSPPIGAFLDATPAMGYVQFPTTIQYGPSPYTSYIQTDTVNTSATGILGKTVPMLYIGTDGSADLGFYAIDVDGGNDTQRGIYRLESPDGSAFTSSPVLVTNSSTTGGNGGAVYATSGNNLLQITATPISNINSAEAYPFVGVDATFSGGGPISGPAVAAAVTTDLPSPNALTQNATDFVYFGDGVLGFCRGITPIDPNDGGAVPPGEFGAPIDTNPPAQGSNKFFLQAYLFDNTTGHLATDTKMGDALGLNSTITGFEWGGFVYIRLGNVVPPCSAADAAAPTANDLVEDPTDTTGSTFYGNGQTVNFSIGAASVTVPATNTAGNPNIGTLSATYPDNVFARRTDPPVNTTASPNYTSTQLVAPTGATGAGNGWVAAYSYPIGSDTSRIGDTPGAFRRIRQASQIASVYTAVKDASGNITGYTPTGTVSLNLQTGIGSQYVANTTPPTIAQTPPTEQPTFGILNPLAVEGLGTPLLPGGTAATAVGDNYGAGPFGPVTSATTPTQTDKAAYANGSNYILNLPTSGYDVTKESPTNVTQYITDQSVYPLVPISIITSVGDIPDGGTGINSVTSLSSPYVNANISALNQFGLIVENRSLIGTDGHTTLDLSGQPLFPSLPVAMQSVGAHWNDNTDLGGTLPQNAPNGPGATVNPLPWEDWASLSNVTANASQDYPDITAASIRHTLVTSPSKSGGNLSLAGGNALLDDTAGTTPANATRQPDYIEVAVTPPPHQPANLQLWSGNTKAPLTPTLANLSTTGLFPQGYIEGTGSGTTLGLTGGTPQRVFVDISGRGSAAIQSATSPFPYRDVQSFAGITVTMKTAITNGTLGLPSAPSSLGIQTEQSTTQGLFDPYTAYYQPFFKPVTVQNEGNTNLLNVQFDQRISGKNGSGVQTLYAYSDANDVLSNIGGFDYARTSGPTDTNGQRLDKTGAVIPLPGASSVNEQSFLFVSSLDTNLVQAYGRNPGTDHTIYPAATFHKPRAGSGPTTLMVPDAPDSSVATFSPPQTVLPTIGSSSLPYVGVALPFGTPVGSYHTLAAEPLRVFEGLDPGGNANGVTAPSPLLPPTYGGAVGGHATVSNAPETELVLDSSNNFAAPVSDPSLTLQLSVLEDRFTDGYTYGALPMVDSGLGGLTPVLTSGQTSVPTATPDFAPAAFRDAAGSLSVYWTSGRLPSIFTIFGANVPFESTNGSYFQPSDPTKEWWGSIGGYGASPYYLTQPVGNLVASGTNSGLSVETGPGNYVPARAFDVVVGSTAPYSNILYSYSVNSASGSLSNPQPITPVSNSSQVKYGVKGLSTGTSFTSTDWAFWTGTTRGRTALYYTTVGASPPPVPSLLPIPAGLTAVTDASPMLLTLAPVTASTGTAYQPVIEVTYSGTSPIGGSDLYVSRYQPDTKTPAQLDLVPFPLVTENLRAAGAWYQARDVAWSTTGALNISVPVTSGGVTTQIPLLYNGATPLFTQATYDKASGLLVLTGVKVPIVTPAANGPTTTTNTVYIDAATGRIRFSPALLSTQTFPQIRGTFSPTARRLTTDTQADTAPVTFIDTALKVNDAPGLNPVEAARRWTIWRKSGGTGAATLDFLTQRLTYFLPSAIGLSTAATPAPLLTSVSINSGPDVSSHVDVDYARGRIYFPLSLNAEGQTVVVQYKDTAGNSVTTPIDTQNTVEWQDEPLANNNDVPPADSVAGLDTILDGTPVPITTATNENNPAAFLDPLASATSPHKVWVFWNSTRNGTSDIYSETFDPRFAPGPATP